MAMNELQLVFFQATKVPAIAGTFLFLVHQLAERQSIG